MKLAVFTHTYMDRSFGDMLDIIKAKGICSVEIGAGGLIGKSHCDPQRLLSDESALKAFKEEYEKRGMEIACLSAHGNPLHPAGDMAKAHDEDIRACVELAPKLGVKTVVTFSGCPGDNDNARYPNWVVAPWPPDFQDILEYQWKKKLIPYWKEVDKLAADNGVNIALELHGGFCVHSPATMIRLREEGGLENVGANIDPSHLWWQGIDPSMAIRHIGAAGGLFYFHAKDTKIEQRNVDYYGLTDTQSYANVRDRAWQFRTIGYGHDLSEWGDMISTLRMMGYDEYISIEHEDAMMSPDEGLNKAIANIRTVLMEEPAELPAMFSQNA